MLFSDHTVRSRLKTRKPFQSLSRIIAIGGRYGVDTRKFTHALNGFVELTNAFKVRPTFPIPATIYEKHSSLLAAVTGRGVGAELAAHGYTHVDYTGIQASRLEKHIQYAKAGFKHQGHQRIGFRFPFLRKNIDLLMELDRQAIAWDSSDVIHWNVLDRCDFSQRDWTAYERIMETYAMQSAARIQSLPYFIGNLVEIPVSMPDDDILIDRLNILKTDVLYSVWNQILTEIWKRGEILVLQLHPERFFIFEKALQRLLKTAVGMEQVWIASLGEIAEWWRERNGLRFEFKRVSQHQTDIQCRGSMRARLSFGRNPPPGCLLIRRERSDPNDSSRWSVKGGRKPWIGVSPLISDSAREVRSFVRQGLLFERSPAAGDFPVYLTPQNRLLFSTADWMERCPHALLRVDTWPGGNRCALSVTGDIDGLDIWDFGNRFYA
jgi:hypothetical protein